MKLPDRVTRTFLPLATLALLAGCAATSSTRYYTLTPSTVPARIEAADELVRRTGEPFFFELSPVAVDQRLARPQMVVRQRGDPDSQVKVLEQSRWSSSFEAELHDALAGGIAARLGAIDVTRSGALPDRPVWRIDVQLRRFDAIRNDRVDAAFGWTVRRTDRQRAAVCGWSASEPVGPGIDALAQGVQRVAARATDAIARHVLALQANPGADCGPA